MGENMDDRENSAAQDTYVAEPARRWAGRVPPAWLAWALSVIAFSVMAVGQGLRGGRSDLLVLAVVGSTLLSSLLVYLLLRRWARHSKGYIGLGIVLLMVVAGIAPSAGTVDHRSGLLTLVVSPLVAVAAAWCFRRRTPVIGPVQGHSPVTAPRPGGLQGPVDAMGRIADVLVELFPSMPAQWSAAWLDIREIGPHRECVFNVETEGSVYSADLPDRLASKLSQARRDMGVPGNGSWFSGRVTLNPADPGSYQTEFNYSEEPAWRTQPSPTDYLDEFELHDRQTTLPAWFVTRMATAD